MNKLAYLAGIVLVTVPMHRALLGCSGTIATGTGGSAPSRAAYESSSADGSSGAGGSSGTSSVASSAGGGSPTACTSYAGDGCTPGDIVPCSGGMMCASSGAPTGASSVCVLATDQPCTTHWMSGGECECNTPLLLSFDGAPVAYHESDERVFDISATRSQVTDWPTAVTPWLALDRDGSGRIEDGSELFGSMTALSSGRRAANGFEALRELDADGDGRITSDDPGFARILVWSDRDEDRRSSPGELVPLAAVGVVSIDLSYTVEPRCDARNNCEVERASFRYLDAGGRERTGVIIDVHLAAQPWPSSHRGAAP